VVVVEGEGAAVVSRQVVTSWSRMVVSSVDADGVKPAVAERWTSWWSKPAPDGPV